VLVSGIGVAAAISGGSHTPRNGLGYAPAPALPASVLPGADTTLVMWPAGAPIFGTADPPGGDRERR
jgi:hypothetical protein